MRKQATFITNKARREVHTLQGVIVYKNRADILPLVDEMTALGWSWSKQQMKLKRDGYASLLFMDSFHVWNIISGSRICLGVILEGAWEDGVHKALRSRLRDIDNSVVDHNVYVLSEHGVVTLTYEFEMWEEIV